MKELCADKYPSIVDSRVEFIAENDIVKDFMTNTALGPIEDTFQRAGFPNFTIHTIVDESSSQQNIQALKRKTKPPTPSWLRRPTKPSKKMPKPTRRGETVAVNPRLAVE